MACRDKDVLGDIKPPLNMGTDGDPSHGDTKEELKDHGIKVEHVTIEGQKQDINEDILSNVADNLEDIMNVCTEEITSDTKTVIKIEDDDKSSEFDSKYSMEEQYMALEEDTSSNRNTENNLIVGDVAGPSATHELKHEEVDLGVTKMDEQEDATSSESSEVEDQESAGQYSSHTLNHFKHDVRMEKTFGCIKCEKRFSSKHFLDRHIVAQHSNNPEMMKSVTNTIHRCRHCSYITVTKKRLSLHMGTHGEKLEKTFNCIKCEKEFSNKYSLDNHIVTQHSDNNEMMNNISNRIYCCKHCNYITVKADHLDRHTKTHKEKTFECTKCKKEFLSKYSLDNHIVTQHSDNDELMKSINCKIHRCKCCTYITVHSYYLNRHMRTHGEKVKKNFKCIKCEKGFPTKYCLDGHIIARHSEDGEMMESVTSKISHCQHCNYVTVHTTLLTRHMRQHVRRNSQDTSKF